MFVLYSIISHFNFQIVFLLAGPPDHFTVKRASSSSSSPTIILTPAPVAQPHQHLAIQSSSSTSTSSLHSVNATLLKSQFLTLVKSATSTTASPLQQITSPSSASSSSSASSQAPSSPPSVNNNNLAHQNHTTSGSLQPNDPPFFNARMPFWSCVWVVLLTTMTVRYFQMGVECILLIIYPRRLVHLRECFGQQFFG
jgi:hypothetical protein